MNLKPSPKVGIFTGYHLLGDGSVHLMLWEGWISVQFFEIRLPRHLTQNLQEVSRRSSEDRIVMARNELRGHGHMDLANNAYREDFQRFLPTIQHLESQLFPILGSISVRQVMNATRVDECKVEVTYQKLMGDHPDFEQEKVQEEIPVENIPITNRTYV